MKTDNKTISLSVNGKVTNKYAKNTEVVMVMYQFLISYIDFIIIIIIMVIAHFDLYKK